MRWFLILVCALALALPAGAAADGDPGSDVLIYQSLFTGADDNISPQQQVALGKLLSATKQAGKPVRVAIIGHSDDLGAVTPLWQKPLPYAQYLGTELSAAFHGHLVVVMPNGVATYSNGHAKPLTGIHSGASAQALVAAATRAIPQAAGVSAGALDKSGGGSTQLSAQPSAAPPGASGGHNLIALWIALGVLALGAVALQWRRRPVLGLATTAVVVPIATIAALVVVISKAGHSNNATALAQNPNIDPGSAPGQLRLAPGFRLTDETGHQVSLNQYRGKVVLLAFTDAECQTICPLTTQAMVDARDSLGSARRDVQLLGVNANWKSTQVDDVLSYTQLHGLSGQWHFLTGSLPSLKRVWRNYGIEEDIKSNLIDHTPALYLIDTHGRIRRVYTTQQNYGAIPQFGQVLAQTASKLLPQHPKVSTKYSYNTVKGISPSTPTTVPKLGGGSVKAGSGGPHLYLFFATWDQQSTALADQLKALNRYRGKVPLTAVDEGSVEPNPQAVKRFLAPLHLNYPVAIDTTGRLADGYLVQGEPWFVLTNPGAANDHPWYQEVYTQGWPKVSGLAKTVDAALSRASKAQTASLAGSPPALAALHAQASRVLPGGLAALTKRIRGLRGHPVVLNIWGSWCQPCQHEYPLFAAASAKYGKHVAFLGLDYNEPNPAAGQQFLAQHRVSYPSYSASGGGSIPGLLPGGVQATPTTVFIKPNGQLGRVWIEPFESAGSLDQAIGSYALGR
ncbi:MAG: redoxin domain-containing protein [Solirubrobacterales bacterium]|nr:redoxin domain-containing protein [Solirubrobacterales bacterium]